MKKQFIFIVLLILVAVAPFLIAKDQMNGGTSHAVKSSVVIPVEFCGSSFNLTQGTVTTWIDIDVHPRSCPNPFNPLKNGVLPAAILGSSSFDVTSIVAGSVRMMDVVPLRSVIEDVSNPVGDPKNRLYEDCTTSGPDGYLDLNLKFDARQIAAAIGPTQRGQIIPVTITALSFDGTPLKGTDYLIIRSNLGKESVENATAESFELVFQNYPNPFNANTTISYTLPEQSIVNLEVYNIIGSKMAVLQNGLQNEGSHFVKWNGRNDLGQDLPTGIYVARITAGTYLKTIHLVLLR